MKPTYEELERQLEESRREFRAANATIHNLELKAEQLVAENGQMLRLLTDISENHDEYVNADEYLYAGVPMDYVSEINAYVSRDVDAENPFMATDAFLAEVRAHDLNAFIRHHSAELDAHIKNGGEQFDEKSVRIRDIIVSARLFREQIRKGVQS